MGWRPEIPSPILFDGPGSDEIFDEDHLYRRHRVGRKALQDVKQLCGHSERGENLGEVAFLQRLPDVLRDNILVERTEALCDMPKYPVLLCEDEQLRPIHRACPLHQPLGVKCGRGALKENGPFVKERLRIGLTGWGQRLLRADSTLVYVIQACLLRYNRRGQDSRRAHPDSLRDAQGPRVALRGGVIGTTL